MKTLKSILIIAALMLPAAAMADSRYATVMSVKEVKYFINKSDPAILGVWAKGEVNSGGWTDGQLAVRIYIEKPADGIVDFDFIAKASEGIVIWPILDIDAFAEGPLEDWMKGIRVHSTTNAIEVKFGDGGPSAVSHTPLRDGLPTPWPFPWNTPKAD